MVRLPRSVLLFAAVAVIGGVLLLLPRLAEEESVAPEVSVPADVIMQSDVEACLGGRQAGTGGCTSPALQACLASLEQCPDDLRILVTDVAAPTADEGGGDLLLVVLVVITPFAMVLGPLLWRTNRLTKRRNAEAFASELPAMVDRGFVVADDVTPNGFELRLACQRAARILVRAGSPRLWLFEYERPSTLTTESWPVRSAVMELSSAAPSGQIFPARDAGRSGERYVSTFPTGPDNLLERVRPVLDGACPYVGLVAKHGLVEVRAGRAFRQGFRAPPAPPLALADLADLADAIAAALTVDAADVDV